MNKSVPLKQLLLAPGERADIIIDFSNNSGENIHLKNDLGPDADPDDRTGDVMQFKVGTILTNNDASRIPVHLSSIPSLKNNRITTMRNLKLSSTVDSYERPVFLFNNQKWTDPVSEKPHLNTTEIWSFINVT